MIESKRDIRPPVIFLMGPTASGKTALALAQYQRLPTEIISVDSALIYRGMDIGTGKPSIDELARVSHRLIDIRDPTEFYSVADFCRDALHEIEVLCASERIPLLVGGSMLYFKALLEGLSPLPSANFEVRARIEHEAKILGWAALYRKLQEIDPICADRIHCNDQQRLLRALEVFFISGSTLTELMKTPGKSLVGYQVHQFALAPLNRVLLHQRIEHRFRQMLINGFENEVSRLFFRGDINNNMASIRSVGYRQMWSYLAGEIDYDDMVFRGICATRQLAKRQMTWLRGWSEVHWLDSDNSLAAINRILQVVSA